MPPFSNVSGKLGIKLELDRTGDRTGASRAHASMDAWSRDAEAGLGDGDAGPRASDPQTRIVESLAAIISALDGPGRVRAGA